MESPISFDDFYNAAQGNLSLELMQELESAREIIRVENAFRPPNRLYRFRSLASADYRSEELRRLFDDCQVFAARPSSFNDPHDCSPVINPNSREEAQAFAWRYLDRQTFRPVVTELMEGLISRSSTMNESDFQELLMNGARSTVDSVYSETGCACFTERSESTAMWYHYANSYKGVCYRFELPEGADDQELRRYFSDANHRLLPVGYTLERSTLDALTVCKAGLAQYDRVLALIAQRDIRDFIRAAYFTKSTDWRYEEEIRLYSSPGQGYVSISPYTLTGVLLGPHVNPDVERDVLQHRDAHEFEILRTEISPTHFGVNLASVA